MSLLLMTFLHMILIEPVGIEIHEFCNFRKVVLIILIEPVGIEMEQQKVVRLSQNKF